MAKPRSIRRRARRDGNHAEIVRIFESLGASWLDTSNIGGALDGVLGVSGIDQRVEIKNPNATRGRTTALKITTEEVETFNEWQGRKPVIIEDIDGAVALVNKMRREHVSKL